MLSYNHQQSPCPLGHDDVRVPQKEKRFQKIVNAITAYGGTPRIYPKLNSVIKQKGSKAWTEMLLAFIADPQQWLEEYHMRSISESGNSVIKRRFPRNLLKRNVTRRKCEAFSRACIYNLRQLNYIHYLCPEIDVYWLN